MMVIVFQITTSRLWSVHTYIVIHHSEDPYHGQFPQTSDRDRQKVILASLGLILSLLYIPALCSHGFLLQTSFIFAAIESQLLMWSHLFVLEGIAEARSYRSAQNGHVTEAYAVRCHLTRFHIGLTGEAGGASTAT
jgi:hypothetical protein